MPVSVPSSAARLLASAPAVGVSGSRQPAPPSLAALAALLASLPPAAAVLVGCTRGIDAAARQALAGSPRLQVFRASTYGRGAWAFAARSIACVQATHAAGGVWCSFPAGPCPAGLAPSSSSSSCFCGTGSGTWSSLALALGLGCPAIVFLPAGTSPPSGWSLSPAGGGWFTYTGSQQLGLFQLLV